MKSSNWILHARVGKKCLWHDALSWIWTDALRGPRICLMYDMVLSTVLCMTWSHHMSFAWHGPFICRMSDMVLLSVLCFIWSTVLSYA